MRREAFIEGPLVYNEGLADAVDRRVDIRVRMRGADRERRGQDPATNRLAEKQCPELLRRLLPLVARRVDEIARATDDVEVPVQAEMCDDAAHAVGQTLALAPERLHDA